VPQLHWAGQGLQASWCHAEVTQKETHKIPTMVTRPVTSVADANSCSCCPFSSESSGGGSGAGATRCAMSMWLLLQGARQRQAGQRILVRMTMPRPRCNHDQGATEEKSTSLICGAGGSSCVSATLSHLARNCRKTLSRVASSDTWRT